MADFFSNLLLRSAADPFPSALLQPRLPSLFEPPTGRNETPLAAPEPVQGEANASASEPAATASPVIQLPATRSSIAIEPLERQPVIKPVENRRPPALQQPMLPSDDASMATPIVKPGQIPSPQQTGRLVVTETQQEVIQPIQPARPSPARIAETLPLRSRLKEPQRTIVPHPEGRSARKPTPAIEAHRSAAPKDHRKISPAEPLALDAPYLERIPRPAKIEDPLPMAIRPLKEDSVFEDSARSIVEPVSLKASSKPEPILQPVLPASRPALVQQSEPTQGQAPQRVVEIRIGRIEVRATPTPTPLKRASQKTSTMSLEEYLRSRPGEKQ